MLLQDIRRRTTKKQYEKDFELAREEKMDDYKKKQKILQQDEDIDRSLVQVQEDLLKLFGKLKVPHRINLSFLELLYSGWSQINISLGLRSNTQITKDNTLSERKTGTERGNPSGAK